MIKTFTSKMLKKLPGTRCERRQLVVLVVVAATAFLLTGCSGLKNLPPAQALNKALLNTVEAKSYVADLTLSNPRLKDWPLPIKPALKNISKVELSVKKDRPKKNKAATALTLTVFSRHQKKENLALDLFINKKDFYFVINKLPQLFESGLNSLVGQAYQIPITDIAGLLPQQSLGRLMSTQNINPKKILKAHPNLFKDIKELPAAEFGGEPVRHFKLRLNKSTAENIAGELADNGSGKEKEGAKIKWPDNLFDKKFDIWVGLKSKKIVRIKSLVPENARLAKSSFRFDLRLSRFDQDLKLSPPNGAQALNLLELMGKLGQGAGKILPDEQAGTQNDAGNDTTGRDSSGNQDKTGSTGQNNLDIGNSTLPGLPQVEFPVQ